MGLNFIWGVAPMFGKHIFNYLIIHDIRFNRSSSFDNSLTFPIAYNSNGWRVTLRTLLAINLMLEMAGRDSHLT